MGATREIGGENGGKRPRGRRQQGGYLTAKGDSQRRGRGKPCVARGANSRPHFPRPRRLQMVRRKFVNLDNVPYIGNGVSVAPSGIPNAGNGLFAERAFCRGDVVTFMDGYTLSDRDVRDREPHQLSHVRTLMTHFLVIDGLKEPFEGAGGGSFANDSLCPKRNNARFETWRCDDLSRFNTVIVLRAKRDISRGEEIFVSYGSTYWRRHAAAPAAAQVPRAAPVGERRATRPSSPAHNLSLKRRRPPHFAGGLSSEDLLRERGVVTRARARRRRFH